MHTSPWLPETSYYRLEATTVKTRDIGLLTDLSLFHGLNHHSRRAYSLDHIRPLKEIFTQLSVMTIQVTENKSLFSCLSGNHHFEIYTDVPFTLIQNLHSTTVQVIKKCPDVLSVLLGTDSTTVRSTVSTTVHSTVSTYVRYASKKSVRTVR